MRLRRSFVVLLAAFALGACRTQSATPAPTPTTTPSPTPTPTPAWMWIETGDLPALQNRGVLRILAPREPDGEGYLPRDGFPRDVEHDELEAFAKEAGLTPVWVYEPSHEQLIPDLLAGKGDVIAASMTVTDERKAQVAFSVAVERTREQLIVRQGEKAIRRPADLAARHIAVRKSSTYWASALALQAKVPSLVIDAVPENVETEAILDGVAQSTYDTTIADANLVDAVFAWRDDLKIAFDVSGDRPQAYAMRPGAKALLAALDRFLQQEQIARARQATYTDDLPGIERRKVLRVLTRNSAATYFLWKGEVLGFDYELAREFAKRHGVRLEVVVPPSRDDLIPWLLEGKGDVIAAELTPTVDRATQVAFSRPYAFASEILVARPADAPKTPADLAGRTVVVRKSSSYWSTIQKLKDGGMAVNLVAAPEELETEELIAKVASGEYDLTVADSPILDIELTWREDVTGAFALGEPVPHEWAARPEDRQLVAAMNDFLKSYYKSAGYNLCYRKYFESRGIASRVEFRSQHPGELSPYDELLRHWAGEAGFDWRLIAAQMYQESRFDPTARSWVGAVGLLQVLPETAKELGFDDPGDPETGIRAGVGYLAWLRDQFDRSLSVEDRTWFSLAAYNAGIGHVIDARAVARRRGLDGDRWFGNVETAMLLLQKPDVAAKSRFGWCRGEEPVDYVRKIRDRYDDYRKAAPADPALNVAARPNP